MVNDRLLVTGATGFVGSCVLRHWSSAHPDVEVWATSDRPDPGARATPNYRQLDLRNKDAVRELVRESRPTAVVHLASVISGAELDAYLDVNVLGTAQLYDALARSESEGVRVAQVGSAAMYGAIGSGDLPISEEQPLRPVTAYAVSKAVQENIALLMATPAGLDVIPARVFNLLGPGQPEDLVPMTFVRQLADVKRGAADRLRAGLLTARRDFVDVRDAAAALDLLLAEGEAGLAYNIASGRDVSVGEIINELLSVAATDVPVEVESARLRKTDVPVVRADISRITSLGWRPRIPLAESLKAMWAEALRDGV